VLSTGLVLTLPTGPSYYSSLTIDTLPTGGTAIVDGTEYHSTLIQPFVGYICNLAAGIYLHGFPSAAFATSQSEVNFFFNDIGLGWWLYRATNGGTIRGLVPTLDRGSCKLAAAAHRHPEQPGRHGPSGGDPGRHARVQHRFGISLLLIIHSLDITGFSDILRPMQLEALKIFCEVARCRSFSQAAAASDMTQSAVSQIVRMLEDRLGVQLIDRGKRPLQLTPLGKVYYEGCKGVVEQFDELEASIRHRQAEIDATIQVAAIYSVGLGDMGQLIDRFSLDNPGTRVHVEYLHPDRVYERVLERSADIGLVSFPRQSRELLVVPWREEPMVLACAPQHPLAGLRSISPQQLSGAKFVGFDRDLVIRRHVDRFLRQHQVSVEVVMEFDNIENIKKAVEIDAGVALLPEPTFHREVQAGTLVARPLAGCRLVRPLGIMYSRHHRLNTPILRFMDLLRNGPGSPSVLPLPTSRGDAAHPPLPNGEKGTDAHAGVNGSSRTRSSAANSHSARRSRTGRATQGKH
jgi:DNA-binding transcriptional LysR family regulator